MTDQLQFHPFADLFPLMEGAEFDELVADIKANGQHEPIVTYEGMILDGRNRYRACLAAGRKPVTVTLVPDKPIFKAFDPVAFIISKNIHRRHLTAEQKRELIAKLLKAQPEKSNRQIAKATGVSHTHVNKVRSEMEEAGDVETVSTSVDTKGRKQPRRKAKAEPDASSSDNARAAARKPIKTLDEEQDPARFKQLKLPIDTGQAAADVDADDQMPTEAEAEESYQETLYDQTCLILERMSDETRQRFLEGLIRRARRAKPESDGAADMSADDDGCGAIEMTNIFMIEVFDFVESFCTRMNSWRKRNKRGRELPDEERKELVDALQLCANELHVLAQNVLGEALAPQMVATRMRALEAKIWPHNPVQSEAAEAVA